MRSFSLIETIFAVVILVLMVGTIYETLILGVKTLGRSRLEEGALALATQKIEFIRNLPYEQIGTSGGIPSGALPQNAAQVVGGVSYTVDTFIQYIDDSVDGTGSDDTNSIVSDYKEARVKVSWASPTPITPVTLISRFSPPGIETTSGGGTLKITALNAVGQPIALAAITVRNAVVSPAINVTTFSSNQGEAMFAGAPSAGGYEVIVTKTGYSQAQTYPASAQNINPSPGFLTVLPAETVQSAFLIDTLASLSITASSTTQSVANINFRIKGEKTIGQDGDGNSIYKYDQTLATNAQGQIAISPIEWDRYTISVENPYIITNLPEEPIAVDPGSDTQVFLSIQ